MLTLMRSHVDDLARERDSPQCRVHDLFRVRDERDHRSVVIGIDMRVEHARGFDISIASARRETDLVLRPSLKFGTHSTDCQIPIADFLLFACSNLSFAPR